MSAQERQDVTGRSARRRLRTTLALLFAVSSIGCIFVVSPEAGGEHCRFRGGESECARCVSTRCTSEIDAACFDEPVLGAVEQCAERGDDACDRLSPSALTTCVQRECLALCSPRVGTSATRCTDAFAAPGLACSCSAGSGPPNDMICGPSVYPRTRCCAPPAWPGPALECACKAVSCQPSSGGCICTLSNNLDANTAEECRGEHCCAVDDRCQCRARPCSGEEREVPFCSKGELACPQGTTEVEACSIRE